jgi:hypothetical protein
LLLGQAVQQVEGAKPERKAKKSKTSSQNEDFIDDEDLTSSQRDRSKLAGTGAVVLHAV